MELTPIHRIILEAVKTSGLSKIFYWTGGTLLSHYYLKHRLSFDIDLFSDSSFSHDLLLPFIEEIKSQIPDVTLSEKKIFDRWEFLIKTPREYTRCEFVHYNGQKKRLSPLTSYRGIMIDSLADMAANKTMAYFDRNEPKDLFDLYTLLKQKKFTVKQLLEMVEHKFGATFSEFSFWSESAKSLKQLHTLKPYLLGKDEKKRQETLKKVEDFFLDGGSAYLAKNIG